MDDETRHKIQMWMSDLANGERTAFAPLFATLWPIFLRFCERALPASPDAEDTAQNALMKVFSRASEFDKKRDALSWTLGIVAFECKTTRQRLRRRREDSADLTQNASHQPSPEHEAIRKDLEQAARTVLGSLSEIDMQTLSLVMSEERPQGATFRKRVERALKRFRSKWSANYGSD